MKSARQLVSELTGIRLNATSVSLWNIADEVTEYARQAINNALALYPPVIEDVYTSGVSGGAGSEVALPRSVEGVGGIYRAGTDSTSLVRVEHFRVHPTPATTWVEVLDSYEGRLDIHYYYKLPELPKDIYVVSDSSTIVNVSSGEPPVAYWPAPPVYVEATYRSQPEYREVFEANYYTVGAVHHLTRAVEGYGPTSWSPGAQLSLVVQCREKALVPVLLQAEANLYQTWVRDRAAYDQYTAIASSQAMDIETLLTIIGNLEIRARTQYRQVRNVMKPLKVAGRREPLPR